MEKAESYKSCLVNETSEMEDRNYSQTSMIKPNTAAMKAVLLPYR